MAELARRPGQIPDEDDDQRARTEAGSLAVAGGLDTDGDGSADTAVTDDGIDLVLHTDLDGDGFADQILRIGPDAVVRDETPPMSQPGDGVLDGLLGGVDAGSGP